MCDKTKNVYISLSDISVMYYNYWNWLSLRLIILTDSTVYELVEEIFIIFIKTGDFTVQVLKFYRTPGPIACSKLLQKLCLKR